MKILLVQEDGNDFFNNQMKVFSDVNKLKRYAIKQQEGDIKAINRISKIKTLEGFLDKNDLIGYYGIYITELNPKE